MDSVPIQRLLTIEAHKGPVHVARFDSNGRYVLSGGADRKIHLFNASSPNTAADGDGARGTASAAKPTARPIKSYEAHSGAVLALSVAGDNATFASGGQDRSVIQWDVASGQAVRRFASHAGAVHVVMHCGGTATPTSPNDVLAVAGFDCALRFYDLRARGAWKPIMECKEAKDTVLCADWHEGMVWTGSVDGVVRTYDLRAGQLRQDTIDRPITSVQHGALGKTLLVTALGSESNSNSLHVVMDNEDGSHLQSIQGGPNEKYRCRSTLWSNDASIIAGDERGMLGAWDVLLGKPLHAWRNAPAASSSAAVLWTECSESKRRMVTAAADGTLCVWNVPI